MARATIEAPRVRPGKKENLFAALAAVDGVRSVREDERGERLEIEYDETLVSENKLIEVAREHHVESDVPTIADRHTAARRGESASDRPRPL